MKNVLIISDRKIESLSKERDPFSTDYSEEDLNVMVLKIENGSTCTSKTLRNKRSAPGKSVPSVKGFLKKQSRPGCSENIRFDGDGHWSKKLIDSNFARRCRAANCRRRTRYFCVKCTVSLCPECMDYFHALD